MKGLISTFRLGLFICLALLSSLHLGAQEHHCTTGLMGVPTAEMAEAGTFRGVASYLSKEFIPDQFVYKDGKYNTGSYGVGISATSWLELSYVCTLLKFKKFGHVGYINEDRHVSVKVRPLKEGRWWPAIAVGMDDVGRFDRIKDGMNENNYYQNMYIVGSKHFDLNDNEIGVHAGYRYFSSDKNRKRRGIAGGLSYRPQFCKDLRFMAEWDGKFVNAGADILLWKHLFVQACFTNGLCFSSSISYHFKIPY